MLVVVFFDLLSRSCFLRSRDDIQVSGGAIRGGQNLAQLSIGPAVKLQPWLGQKNCTFDFVSLLGREFFGLAFVSVQFASSC